MCFRFVYRWKCLELCVGLAVLCGLSNAEEPPLDNSTTRTFELRVVGPGGEVIPSAKVEFRSRTVDSAEAVEVGTFERKASYGAFVVADEKGVIRVRVKEKNSRFVFAISHPGFAPYWGEWTRQQAASLPDAFTAELEGAWTVGGVVIDDDGDPIAGVTLQPSIQCKRRPGDPGSIYTGARIKTDDRGHWKYECVPDSYDAVRVEINHVEFMSNRASLSRSKYELKDGEVAKEQITIEPGLAVKGSVSDENGRPIIGAVIRAKFLNDLRETKSDKNGDYRLVGCEPRMARFVASKKGFALTLREVRVERGMDRVDFEMPFGRTIRVRVLDENDKPIPKTRIFFQRWAGKRIDYFEFDHVDAHTDSDGVWEWNEAPIESIHADICRPGGMQLSSQLLTPRDEEHVFRPPRQLVVHGKVVDAETNEPIREFQVIPGIRHEGRLNWVRSDAFVATDGNYDFPHLNHGYDRHLVRIEAEGYLAAVSRGIKNDEERVAIDFELERGKDVVATVTRPDGSPAANADVILGIAGSQISIENGRLDSGSTYDAPQRVSDANGKFKFPPQNTPFQLVILHDNGYAHVKAMPNQFPSRITLKAWAQIEGVFRVGNEVVPDVGIEMSGAGIHSYGDDVPNIFTHPQTITGKDGTFSFDRAFAGRYRIGRQIILMVGDGATEVTSSCRVPIVLQNGNTKKLELGGRGVAVTGALSVPGGGEAPWSLALVNVDVDLRAPTAPPVPDGIKQNFKQRQAWMQQWRKTPRGIAWQSAVQQYQVARDNSVSFTVTVDRNGRFRIDDVPPGNYRLSVRFSDKLKAFVRNHPFVVTDIDGATVDVGHIQLHNRP